jgi:hypothetical protein
VRLKSTLVVLLIVVASAAPLSVTGQEEPLPPVVARLSVDYPTVALEVEPFHAAPQLTLAEAARANDFPTFDALFREANRRGESLGAYATLHELWSSSINDPIGAFYGPDLYERLARAYPGYARYIEDYRIIDSRGNVFYPASETRTFLLARAVEGVRVAPRVLVAEASAASPGAQSSPGAPASSPAGPAASRRRVSATKRVSVPKVTSPARAAARDAAGPAGEDASAPLAPAAPVVVKAEPVATPAPVATQPVVTAPPVTKPIAAEDNLGNRGILLLVIGLIGIGLLAVMLRTPKEAQPQTIMPAPVVPPVAAAEPLRRPTPAPAPKPAEPAASESNRATGSHG